MVEWLDFGKNYSLGSHIAVSYLTMNNCTFCQIVEKKLKSSIIYEDKSIVVINDINPRAEFHVLIISKKHVPDFNEADLKLLEKINRVIKNLIKNEKLLGQGYRLVVNGGGAQLIDHLHIHLLGKINKTREI